MPAPIVCWIVALGLSAWLVGVGMWRMFEKADLPGWLAFVPFLNTYALVRLAERPSWWVFAIWFVPLAGAVLYAAAVIDVAERFGRGALFGLGMALPLVGWLFMANLGHSGAVYEGDLDLGAWV
jgi:hypothetical protein